MIDKLTDRLKKIKLPLIKRIWDSDILLAIVINFIFLSAILLFCDVKYEVSDDFIMSAIMSGAYGSAPNPHMIFSSILWGYLLLPFYYIFPVISWYLVFQLLLCFVSFTLVSYMVLKKLDRMMACMLITMLLTFFGDDVYILVQFTKTAMLAVMGGGIVFAWALFNEKSKTVKTISALVCLAGTLIRFSVVYIAGGFLLFILLVEFVKIILSKSDSVKKKRKLCLYYFLVY